jgi:hypothetical protein
MDGSGKAVTCDTDEYETLGEFVTVLPKKTLSCPSLKNPLKWARTR